MYIKHSSHLVLTLSLYNFQHVILLLSMHMTGSPDVMLVWSPHLFGFGKLSRMLVKALAKHHFCRSRADSRRTLTRNHTERNVLWNKMQRGICLHVYSTCPQLYFLTVWRMSKQGLLTITCHTLDVFSVLKCSFKHRFGGLEIQNNMVFSEEPESLGSLNRPLQKYANVLKSNHLISKGIQMMSNHIKACVFC